MKEHTAQLCVAQHYKHSMSCNFSLLHLTKISPLEPNTWFLIPVHLPISSWPVRLQRECPDKLSRLPHIPPSPLQLIFCKIQYSWGWEVCCSWQKFEPALCKHNLKVKWRGRCNRKKPQSAKALNRNFIACGFWKA